MALSENLSLIPGTHIDDLQLFLMQLQETPCCLSTPYPLHK